MSKIMRRYYNIIVRLMILSLCMMIMGTGTSCSNNTEDEDEGFRGVFYNPDIFHPQIHGYPFPHFLYYAIHPHYRIEIRESLNELVDVNINLVSVFVCNLHTFDDHKSPNEADQSIDEWGNFAFLSGLSLFIDDCYDAGISVEIALVDNRWIPYTVDSTNHIGQPGGFWPVAGDTPWKEAANWYSSVINYVEENTNHPESIAMWSMMGNYQYGSAEPMLWSNPANPKISEYTERFVKEVWPVFFESGERPKGSPYSFPIFSNNSYWMSKTPDQRLEGVLNIHKWLVDDLNLSPDYWMISTYPFSDNAGDGFNYIDRIVEIFGRENANKIISTDLKSEGHEADLVNTIIQIDGKTGADMLDWNLKQVKEYGFAGWWIWSYQDAHANDNRGIKRLDGTWKMDLIEVIESYID